VTSTAIPLSFNGDDKIALFRDADNSAAFNAGDYIIDAFGVFATDYAAGAFQDQTYSRADCTGNYGTTGFPTTWAFGSVVAGWNKVAAFTTEVAGDAGATQFTNSFKVAPSFTCP
jgi:hypothetical protein